jgi:hypothetical protein
LWRPGRALAQEATPVLVCSTGRDAVWAARLKDAGAQRRVAVGDGTGGLVAVTPSPAGAWVAHEAASGESRGGADVPGQAPLAVSDRQGVKLLGFDGSTQGTIAVPGAVSSISGLTGA